MAEEIAFENSQISNFEGIVTLTSSTSTYVPNFIKIKKTLCGWMDVCKYTDGRTDRYLRPALLGRLSQRVDLKSMLRKTQRKTASGHRKVMQGNSSVTSTACAARHYS